MGRWAGITVKDRRVDGKVGGAHPSAPVIASNQQGESPRRSVLAFRNRWKLRRREAGWRASGGERLVRNASELDSADRRGEPARYWRSPIDAWPSQGGHGSVAR